MFFHSRSRDLQIAILLDSVSSSKKLYGLCSDLFSGGGKNAEDLWPKILKVQGYMGFIGPYLITISDKDLDSIFKDSSKTRDSLDHVAACCAGLLGIGKRFRHSTSLCGETLDFLNQENSILPDFFIDRLFYHCQRHSVIAVNNLITSPWYNEDIHASCLPAKLKNLLEGRGDLSAVVVAMVGKEGARKAFRRFGWHELMHLAGSKDKKQHLSVEIGI